MAWVDGVVRESTNFENLYMAYFELDYKVPTYDVYLEVHGT